MEARAVIEMATVRLAVMRADEEALAEIEENVRKQKEAIGTGNMEAFIKLDVEFHFCLAKASGNKVLLQFLSAVTDLLRRFIREVALLPRATLNALNFHTKILEFIRDRDADSAERTLFEHLTDVVKNIEKSTGCELGPTFHFMAGRKRQEKESQPKRPGGRKVRQG